MAFDQRLIGLWVLPERQDDVVYELTASGRLFIHDIPSPYQVAADGKRLNWVDAPAFDRVGEPATGLEGSWQRHHDQDDVTETVTFNADGSYLSAWDPGDNYWGMYEDLGDTLRTIEYRGQVSTDEGRYRHVVSSDSYLYRYVVHDENSFTLFDDENGLDYRYQRAVPSAS
jgi:hypothetical protein